MNPAFHLLSRVEAFRYGFRRFGSGSIIKPFPGRIHGAKYVSIGDECFFGSGLTIVASDEFMGKKHQPDCTFGDRCGFGADFVLSCTNTIRIGNDVIGSARVFIGDSYHGYEAAGVPVKRQPMSGEAPVSIGDGSFLGIGSVVLPGTTLGRGCYVGANAVVRGHFDDYTVIAGNPGRAIRVYDPEQSAWARKHH